MTACFVSVLVNFMIGPSQILGLPNSLYIMAFGQLASGVVYAFLLVPVLPEMIDSVSVLYPKDEVIVNDLSSAIFSSIQGVGSIFGPIYGSMLTKYFNFRLTADSVALIMLIYSILYFTLCDGYSDLKYSLSRCLKAPRKRYQYVKSPSSRKNFHLH